MPVLFFQRTGSPSGDLQVFPWVSKGPFWRPSSTTWVYFSSDHPIMWTSWDPSKVMRTSFNNLMAITFLINLFLYLIAHELKFTDTFKYWLMHQRPHEKENSRSFSKQKN